VKFTQHLKIIDKLADLLERVGPNLFRSDTFKDCLRLLRVVPEIRLLSDQFFIANFESLAVVVKDTSSRQQREPSSLSTCL